MSGSSNGAVVVYSCNGAGFARAHDRASRTELAKRIARLKGFDFAGEHGRTSACSGPIYFVPSDTLLTSQAASLGIRSEQDLFGGVVPRPFVATKAITHRLVGPDAWRPEGWSQEFARRVQDVVLLGYSTFSFDDAREACSRLLYQGSVRIKPAGATGGCGQSAIATASELNRVLDGMVDEAVSTGLVLEEDLSDVTTYSVGQVHVADLLASYYGTQRLTPDNGGNPVYGGSTLEIVRGDFEALLKRAIPEQARIAIAQAQVYDAAAKECFPGLHASRCNYDVLQGRDARGRLRSGVLEQSWRPGGASCAEIMALEAFRSEPSLDAIRVSSVESYGDCDSPPEHAMVTFRGMDENVGMITKYALVERYGDPQ